MPKTNLITLCETAGFTRVYRGPYQNTEPGKTATEETTEIPCGPWQTDRGEISTYGHIRYLLSTLNVEQKDMESTPQQHYAYAKLIGEKGVEIFHFWDPQKWQTGNSRQVIRAGLTYFCFPNHDRITAEWKRQPNGNIFLLGGIDQPKGAYPDKWDTQAHRILTEYACNSKS